MMNINLYQKASDLEETNPEEALEIYNKLEKENKEFHKYILLTSIICPIFAFIIALFVVQFISSHQTIATVLVLSVIGFGPPLLIFGSKYFKQGERHTGVKVKPIERALWVLLTGPIAILGGLITIVFLVLGTLLIEAIFLIPLSVVYPLLTGAPFILPENIKILLFFVFFIPFFLFVVSEVRLIPFSIRRILMKIPVGLKLRSGNILKFIASTAVGIAIVGGGALGILYEDVLSGVIVYCFTGLLVGLAFSRGVEKDFILGNLYRIARARCLIRLDRHAEASYRLKIFVHHPDYPPFSLTPVVKYLVYASIDLINDFPNEAEEYLNEAAKSISGDDKYREIYLDSIQKTRQLAGLSNNIYAEITHDLIVRKEWDELIRLGEPSVEPLIQALKDEEWGARYRAAEALGEIGDARVVEPLIQALKDENPDVRMRTARALGKIGDERAVEPLIQALKDEYPVYSGIREAIKDALENIKSNKS